MTDIAPTSRHIYWINENFCGLFEAHMQPINQKTGKPWQAPRRITKGSDRCVLFNPKTKAVVMLDRAKVPENWHKSGEFTGAGGGLYSTRELALAAIEAHKATLDGGK